MIIRQLDHGFSSLVLEGLKQASPLEGRIFFPWIGTAEFSRNETSLLLQKYMIERSCSDRSLLE
jgi:hypothetical protein